MEVLTTQSFADRVRTVSNTCRMQISKIVDEADVSTQPCAERLDGDHLVAWTRDTRSMSFWCLLSKKESSKLEKYDLNEFPLAGFSKSDMLGIGVPEQLISSVYELKKLEDLDSVNLSESVRHRLRFVFLQRFYGLIFGREQLVRRAYNVEHFNRYLHGNITELLLHLDETQQRIVDLDGDGTIIVKGVAGSGKTAVALHRIVKILEQRSLFTPPRILFITYNRSLVSYAGELLHALGIKASELTISTLHALCLKKMENKIKIISDSEKREMLLQARVQVQKKNHNSSILAYPETFWQDEIHLIKGRGVERLERYLKLSRFGAGRALDRESRKLVWRVFVEYQEQCAANQMMDWDDVVWSAYKELMRGKQEGDNLELFDFVFIDEAQDLTPMGLRLVNQLAQPGGSLFVAYDRSQSIYEKVGFKWKDCGIRLHGSRSYDLACNYRNTSQIIQAAYPLLITTDGEKNIDDNEMDVSQPVFSSRRGEEPILLDCDTGKEIEVLCQNITDMIKSELIPPQNIAVLCYPNKVRELVAQEMTERSILYQKHTGKDRIHLLDPSVKVLPIKSAKGLEFPIVYLLASGFWYRPHLGLEEDDRKTYVDNMQRVFYMAMTRAMTRLVLVYDRKDPVDFIHHLLD